MGSNRFVVPALLAVIILLLGILAWMQFQGAEPINQRGNDSVLSRQAANELPPANPSENSTDPVPSNQPRPEQPANEPEDNRVIEGEAGTSQEPRRTPPESELKPTDKELQEAKDKAEEEQKRAEQQARQDAMLARGGVIAKDQDGQDLNVRIVWVVPPAYLLGTATPTSVNAHYCGALSEVKDSRFRQHMLEALGLEYLKGDELTAAMQQTWLLTGRVTFHGDPKLKTQDWAGVTRPPVIVTGLGTSASANEQGWFVLSCRKADWASHSTAGISVRFPGWVLAPELDTAKPNMGPAMALAKDPTEQGTVTLNLVAPPALMLELSVDPPGAVHSTTRLWLELFAQQRNLDWRKPEIGLFIEADFPASGVITFVFPDPRTFTTALPTFGAVGEGWSSGTPTVLEAWDRKLSKQPTAGTRFVLLRHTLSMDRASTFLVKGTCLGRGGNTEHAPVRVEAKQTGARTWTNKGAFAFWVELDRGNWQENLIVDPVTAGAFQFNLDYDGQRPNSVALEVGGSAPLGPWRVTLPEQGRFPRYLYCEEVIGAESITGQVGGRTQYIKLVPVEGYAGFYRCDDFPVFAASFEVRTRTGRVTLAALPAGDNVPSLPDGVRQTDPWGNPFPLVVLKQP